MIAIDRSLPQLHDTCCSSIDAIYHMLQSNIILHISTNAIRSLFQDWGDVTYAAVCYHVFTQITAASQYILLQSDVVHRVFPEVYRDV